MTKCELMRRALGLTQAQAANRCGIPLRILNGIESGRINGTEKEAEALERGYSLVMENPLTLFESVTTEQAAGLVCS